MISRKCPRKTFFSTHSEAASWKNIDEKLHWNFFREKPYLSTSLTKKQEGFFAHKTEVMNSRFDNLLKEGSQQFVGNDLPNRFDLLLRKRVQKLCKGTFERHPILEAQLKCLWLSHKGYSLSEWFILPHI